MNITILGTGAFGLALAKSFSIKKNTITLWSKFEQEITQLKNKYLEYKFTTNLQEAINNTDIIVIAIPIEFINETLIEVKKMYQKGIILIASKGIETTNHKFAYEIKEANLPNIPYGILSGGTFAKDMIENKIMGITLATSSKEVASITKQILNSNTLKIEETNDIIGVSICGAIKNVIAIANGILDGSNYPESTKFLFLTESILETQKIIQKLGGDKNTILSYAGIDDFMMTCTSTKSRNFTLGQMIGKNLPPKEIEEYKNNTTIEGLGTSKAIYELLKEKNINSSLIDTIYKILYESLDKSELIHYLEKIQK